MAKPRVVVSRKPPASLERLQAAADTWVWEEDRPCPRELLMEQIAEAEGLFTMIPDQINEELLAAAPKLRVVCTMAVGVDNIEIAACTKRGIPVGYTPGVVTEATADMAFALILALSRRMVESAEFVREGNWKAWSPSLMISNDVFGKTLGIYGMGRIGRAVARRARGFQMRVLYHNRSRNSEAEAELGAEYKSFEALLGESDIVCINAPMTPETHHAFNSARFAQMKPSAFLINVARGGLVNQQHLHQALEAGTIKGAALDVTDPEPIPADDPLRTNPKCIIVPHIGTSTWETRERMTDITIDNLLNGLAGKPMVHCFNPDVEKK